MRKEPAFDRIVLAAVVRKMGNAYGQLDRIGKILRITLEQMFAGRIAATTITEVVVPAVAHQRLREGPNDEEQGRAFDRLGRRLAISPLSPQPCSPMQVWGARGASAMGGSPGACVAPSVRTIGVRQYQRLALCR